MEGNRISKTCKDCNKPFSMTSDEIAWLDERGLRPFTRCKACREAKQNVAFSALCRDCKSPFSISASELAWLKRHGLKPFTRCKACRDALRAEKEDYKNASQDS